MAATHSISYDELLRFYEAAGVDCALEDMPIDQFARAAALQETANPPFEVPEPPKKAPLMQAAPIDHAKPQQPLQKAMPRPSAVPNDQAIKTAQEAAKAANTLDELKNALMAFDGCSLKFTAKNTCFADGTAGSPIMLIGEAPGRDEDIEGLPFVGRSGQLLNLILKAIGLEREQVYIANTIPWRPPGNRTPTPLEIEICRPFIERQIELSAPKILIALGGPAAQSLTGAKQGILRLRGTWQNYATPSGMDIALMPTLHPAYLLRTPAQKKYAWHDFLAVKMKLRSMGL